MYLGICGRGPWTGDCIALHLGTAGASVVIYRLCLQQKSLPESKRLVHRQISRQIQYQDLPYEKLGPL